MDTQNKVSQMENKNEKEPVVVVLGSAKRFMNASIDISYIINVSRDEFGDYSSEDISEQLYVIYLKKEHFQRNFNWAYFESNKYPKDIIEMEKQCRKIRSDDEENIKKYNQLYSSIIKEKRAIVKTTLINQKDFTETIDYLLNLSEGTVIRIFGISSNFVFCKDM